ncbi:MAG: hypothetical protein U0235_28065 [Polyangiaceae bacterium]
MVGVGAAGEVAEQESVGGGLDYASIAGIALTEQHVRALFVARSFEAERLGPSLASPLPGDEHEQPQRRAERGQRADARRDASIPLACADVAERGVFGHSDVDHEGIARE